MNGENQHIATDEPIEFEKQSVEVEAARKLLITLEESEKYTHL